MTPALVFQAALQQYRARPDSWTQFLVARDRFGDPAAPDDGAAQCWCLNGMLFRCYPVPLGGLPGRLGADWPAWWQGLNPDEVWIAINDVLRAEIAGLGFPHIAGWNDDAERTYADVIALLERCVARALANEHKEDGR